MFDIGKVDQPDFAVTEIVCQQRRRLYAGGSQYVAGFRRQLAKAESHGRFAEVIEPVRDHQRAADAVAVGVLWPKTYRGISVRRHRAGVEKR